MTSNQFESIRLSVSAHDDRELHALHCQAGPAGNSPTLVLIHGADRRLQNATHWKPHLPFLATHHCGVFAVDLLGHGTSRPGESDPLPGGIIRIDVGDQIQALTKLIEHDLNNSTSSEKQFILVGRSYGGLVSARLAQQIASGQIKGAKLGGLVLIAPATEQAVIESLPKNIPLLAVWSEEDRIIPPAKGLQLLRSHFEQVQVLLFGEGEILTEAVIKRGEMWRSHTPENEKVKEFQNAMEKFLSTVIADKH